MNSSYRLLACLVWAWVSLALPAHPIDSVTARRTALRFVTQRGKTLSAKPVPARAARRIASTASEDSRYYIFDTEDDGGFVVVSADDRTVPILGYTDSGHYDEAQLPEALCALLDRYAEEIAGLDASETDVQVPETVTVDAAEADGSAVTESARHYIAPLLTTLWGQGDPYNAQCPVYYNADGTSSGKLSATGCVATALAQVMAYYRYPSQTKAAIPSYSFTSGGKTISMPSIAAGTAIDWEHITDTYTSASADEEKAAVAQLMVMVGTGCQMAYGAASAAYLTSGQYFLRDCMGYDESMDYQLRKNYTLAEWVTLIYTEIAQGRPVAYRGTSQSGAHAFVLDGYDSGELFHINWGWGGTANGYFRITALQPSANSGSSGYAQEQEAIVRLMPSDGISTAVDTTPRLTMHNICVSGSTITCTYTNFSGQLGTFYTSIGYLKSDGSIEKLQNGSLTILNNGYEITKSYTVSGLSDGTWHVVPIARTFSSGVWNTSVNPERDYVKAVVKNGVVTLTYPGADGASLSATAWDVRGDAVAGSQQNVTVTLANTGSDEFHQSLYCFASTSADMGTALGTDDVTVVPGSSTDVTYTITPAAAGTYTVWLARSATGADIVGSTTMTIGDNATDTRNLSIVNCVYDNIVDRTVYGNYRRATIYVRNNTAVDYHGQISVRLYKGAIGATKYGHVVSYMLPVDVAAGAVASTVCLTDEVDVDCNYGYTFYYQDGKTALDGKTSVIYARTQRPGVVFYQASGDRSAVAPTETVDAGDAAAVDMRHVATVAHVTPSTNPRAIYVVDADATVPEEIASLNVVRDGHADNITLTHGQASVFPCAVEADAIHYQYVVPTSGRGVGSWETFWVPFTPTNVTANGGSVSFDGQQWSLRTMSGLDAEGHPVFGTVDAVQAGIPYVLKASADRAGQTLDFSAIHVSIPRGGGRAVTSTITYQMEGTSSLLSQSGLYTLNEAGTAFVYRLEPTEVQPFHAYLTTTLSEGARQSTIPIESGTTGIVLSQGTADATPVTVYDLRGVAVAKLPSVGGQVPVGKLPKGVYIINGKKVVR